jgi:hypothetical protein
MTKMQDPDPLVRGMGPRVRIHTKMSWIRNTDFGTDPGPDLDPGLDPDLDPDSGIFVNDLQDTNKKIIKKKSFSAAYSLKVHLQCTSFFEDKKSKRSNKTVFSLYYFCLMIEGSGSKRPKNIWILQIWIHNTGLNHITLHPLTIK